MRSTVVVWDLLIYVPALLMFARVWHGNRSGRTQVSSRVVTFGSVSQKSALGTRFVNVALPPGPSPD
jgi:hypothetical protein